MQLTASMHIAHWYARAIQQISSSITTINHQTKMKSTKHKYSYTVNLNYLLYSRKSHTWRVLFYVDIGTQMKYKALYT